MTTRPRSKWEHDVLFEPGRMLEVPPRKAEFMQRVMVQNPRRKPGTWEPGIVTNIDLHLSTGGGGRLAWRYFVRLDRTTPVKRNGDGGELLFAQVGDDGIREIPA